MTDPMTAVLIMLVIALIAILHNFAAHYAVLLLEIRTELRLHNSREVRRDLRTLSQEEAERR